MPAVRLLEPLLGGLALLPLLLLPPVALLRLPLLRLHLCLQLQVHLAVYEAPGEDRSC